MRPPEDKLADFDHAVAFGGCKILIAAGQAEVRDCLAEVLLRAFPSGLDIELSSCLEDAARRLAAGDIYVLFCHLPNATEAAAGHLLTMLEQAGSIPVIAVGDQALEEGETDIWSMAIGLGVQDYLTLHDLAVGDVRRVVRFAIERQALQVQLQENLCELEQARTQFQSLITDNADALAIISHNRVVRYANPAAERLLGRPLDKLVGSPFPFRLDIGALVEESIKRDDGTRAILAIRYMNTLWEGSRAYIATLRDITERKSAEEALALAKSEAEGANNLKTKFLANMSHELRTPLNSILGFSQLMDMEIHGHLGSAKYKGYVDNITSAGNHLLELINDLLDLSKIEAGHFELAESTFGLTALIDSVSQVLEPRIVSADVSLRRVLPANEIMLRADERKVKQVLFNLLSNAVKFTPPGGEIQVGYRLNRYEELVLFVCDNGIGMSPDQIPRALSAFGQVRNDFVRRPNEGTGLGLTLSKQIAELHGGSLTIRSAIAKGTNVLMTFPADRANVYRSQLWARTG